MSVIQGSKHPEAAWEFVKFYNSREIQELLGENGVEPATIAGRRSFGLNGPLPPGAQREHIYGPILSPPDMRSVAWEVPGMSDIWPDMIDLYDRILLGDEDPRIAVEALVPVLNSKLEQAQNE